MELGERLKGLRKHKKLSMQELANKIGIAKSTYAGYEADYRNPPLETIIALAKQLDTSADYLLGLTANPCPKDDDTNARELLTVGNLHWDGVPLSGEDLEPIRAMIEIVAKERSQRQKLENNSKVN